jgi:hypothetical protein
METAEALMLSVQRLSEHIEALNSEGGDVDDFEDWFLSESWGLYDIHGDALSNAIAAVHQVLHSYQSDELEENRVPKELAAAIRPFEKVIPRGIVVISSSVNSVGRIGPQMETGNTWQSASMYGFQVAAPVQS